MQEETSHMQIKYPTTVVPGENCSLGVAYIELPEHTKTSEHTGNYWNTLSFFIYNNTVCFYDLIAVCLCVGCC